MPARGLTILTEEGRWRGPGFARRLLAVGTEGYPPKVRRRLQTLNAMAYLIVVLSTIYAAIYALDDVVTYRWVVTVNLTLAAVGLSVPLANRIHELAGGLLIVLSEPMALLALVSVLGRDSGIQLNLIVGAAAPLVIFGLGRMGLVTAVIALCFALHVAAWFLFPPGKAMLGIAPELINQLYVSSAFTTFIVIAALFYYAFRLTEQAEAETEAVLRNILPDSIVERLKARPGQPIADSFAEASVLFADLKGFVTLSRALGAERTVAVLNDLTHGFDALAAAHGVEKIKTIGDCYMAVAGVPEQLPDHAARMARMALAMREVADQTARRAGIDLSLRIGIASGPLMAGVIGARKFTYDVWGDPVNLAARLESTGEAGRIHVAAETRAKLADQFDLAHRGAIDIKGVGPQETYFLIGPKSPDPKSPDSESRGCYPAAAA
jgi:adenylate cyclase